MMTETRSSMHACLSGVYNFVYDTYSTGRTPNLTSTFNLRSGTGGGRRAAPGDRINIFIWAVKGTDRGEDWKRSYGAILSRGEGRSKCIQARGRRASCALTELIGSQGKHV